MAKARSRTAARKIKDRWRAKNWYNIVAPASFDGVTLADTLADTPNNLIDRVTAVSLQDLTKDFRRSHITLFFKINNVEENNAHTVFIGHSLTSDYLRRMIRRRRSKIDGVYDVETRDGAKIRIKPFATTDKRIQNSQKRVIREAMKSTVTSIAKTSTFAEFVNNTLEGKIGSEIYKNCKKLYPVKRVEVFKTEVISHPTIKIEEKKPAKKPEKEQVVEEEKKEKKPKKKKEEIKEKPEEKTEGEKTKEEKSEEKPSEKPEKKEPAEKKAKKKIPKAKTVKKTTAKKKTASKTPKKKTTKKTASKTKKAEK